MRESVAWALDGQWPTEQGRILDPAAVNPRHLHMHVVYLLEVLWPDNLATYIIHCNTVCVYVCVYARARAWACQICRTLAHEAPSHLRST